MAEAAGLEDEGGTVTQRMQRDAALDPGKGKDTDPPLQPWDPEPPCETHLGLLASRTVSG